MQSDKEPQNFRQRATVALQPHVATPILRHTCCKMYCYSSKISNFQITSNQLERLASPYKKQLPVLKLRMLTLCRKTLILTQNGKNTLMEGHVTVRSIMLMITESSSLVSRKRRIMIQMNRTMMHYMQQVKS